MCPHHHEAVFAGGEVDDFVVGGEPRNRTVRPKLRDSHRAVQDTDVVDLKAGRHQEAVVPRRGRAVTHAHIEQLAVDLGCTDLHRWVVGQVQVSSRIEQIRVAPDEELLASATEVDVEDLGLWNARLRKGEGSEVEHVVL